MTTQADEGVSSDRCGFPGCQRRADGLFCAEHKAGYRVGDEHPATREVQTLAQASRDGDE